jgi:hypothetical protein
VTRDTRASRVTNDQSFGHYSILTVTYDDGAIGGAQERRAKRKSLAIGCNAKLLRGAMRK